jgi:large subunit ribosomal protein L1
MAKKGKKYLDASRRFDRDRFHTGGEALSIVKTLASAGFDETVELAVRLGVDPRKADQALRGTVALPHGIGKQVRVLVIAKPPKDEEAKAAGADHVGYKDYLEKIQGGWADVDVIIATPDVMGDLGKMGKILGPRGLMPNPKSGTVTLDVSTAVKEIKAGKIEFRVDKAGIVHATVGKANFEAAKLVDNVNAFLATITRLKPSTAKGVYVKSIALSTTMGPGVHIDRAAAGVH